MTALSAEQAAFYREQGCLLVVGVISERELAGIGRVTKP